MGKFFTLGITPLEQRKLFASGERIYKVLVPGDGVSGTHSVLSSHAAQSTRITLYQSK
jgi:hypothetical protein